MGLKKVSLLGDLDNDNRESDLEKLDKITKKTPVKSTKSNTLLDILEDIKRKVDTHLTKFVPYVRECIYSQDELRQYINQCVLDGIVAIDTETTGLDPIMDNIVGLCLYSPSQKAVYVPINHISYLTGKRLENQLTETQVGELLKPLLNTKNIFHNAVFDIRVIWNQCGIRLPVYWDTQIASKLLDESEKEATLKWQYATHIEHLQGKEYDFKSLFGKKIDFRQVPPQVASMYGAVDPLITYQLYNDYQLEQFNLPINKRIKAMMFEIEMPIVDVCVDMEQQGMKVDQKVADALREKYGKKLIDAEVPVKEEIKKYAPQIETYRKTHPDTKLPSTTEINIKSVPQMAELFYDVLKVPLPKIAKKPKQLDEPVLEVLNHPIASALRKYRKFAKLVSTYVEKLPGIVCPKTGRIHCNFNQYGADTGRFSSSNPNMQNIPSRGESKEIRTMFKASDGCVFIGFDYS